MKVGGGRRQKTSWVVEWAGGRNRERDEEVGLAA